MVNAEGRTVYTPVKRGGMEKQLTPNQMTQFENQLGFYKQQQRQPMQKQAVQAKPGQQQQGLGQQNVVQQMQLGANNSDQDSDRE